LRGDGSVLEEEEEVVGLEDASLSEVKRGRLVAEESVAAEEGPVLEAKKEKKVRKGSGSRN
jgi:hypothetical protein